MNDFRKWLFPANGSEEGFHQENLFLSERGVKVSGFLEIGIGLLGLPGLLPLPVALFLIMLGLLLLLAQRQGSLFDHFQSLVACGLGAGAVVSAISLTRGSSEGFLQAAIAILMFAAPATVPLLPWQSMAIGAVVVAAGALNGHAGVMGLLALACILLTAVLYDQRLSTYRASASLLLASQQFRDLQSRTVVTEGSATMVQLSAALAHELSSPIGTVSSAIDTLLMLFAKQAKAPPQEQERLLTLQTDLGRSLQDSMARLKKIVNRIQRLCNLDETVTQPADLNELLREAASLMDPQTATTIEFQWNLQPLPQLHCRPQQLIVVFWNVLLNASQAFEANGRILISSTVQDTRVEVKIEDNGRGISPERLAHIFEPAFNVSDGRVSTGNWSLFTSRQLIKNHGGELRIRSSVGQGTTVTFHLPC